MISIESARAWYPQDDPVHGFDHILRVYNMASHLAQVEGADLEIVRAAALLHDAANPDVQHEGDRVRVNHQYASAQFAQRLLQEEGWNDDRIGAVLHCIRAHRYRDETEQPATLEAQILFDADKLDAIGAIGVARAVAYAALHDHPIYAAPSESFLADGKLEVGELHSAYHEYIFKLSKLNQRLYTPTAKQVGVERHQSMVWFFESLISEVMPGAQEGPAVNGR